MDYCVKLSNIIYKKELLNLCKIQDKIPECYDNHSVKNIRECLIKMKKYLLQADFVTQAYTMVTSSKIYKMSGRQMFAANACSEAVLRNDWASALYELFDCIYDCGNSEEPGKEIDHDETLVFLILINNFLYALENRKKTKVNKFKLFKG